MDDVDVDEQPREPTVNNNNSSSSPPPPPPAVEIVVEDEPQTCFSGFNLRSFVFSLSAINIVTSILSIIGHSMMIIRMVHLDEFEYRYTVLLACVPVFNIGLIIMNVRLITGILNHNVNNIRNWLRVYSALFFGFALFIMVYWANGAVAAFKKYAASYFYEDDFNEFVLSIAACEFWYAGTCYAVYQYYGSERMCAQQNAFLEPQNEFNMTEQQTTAASP